MHDILLETYTIDNSMSEEIILNEYRKSLLENKPIKKKILVITLLRRGEVPMLLREVYPYVSGSDLALCDAIKKNRRPSINDVSRLYRIHKFYFGDIATRCLMDGHTRLFDGLVSDIKTRSQKSPVRDFETRRRLGAQAHAGRVDRN